MKLTTTKLKEIFNPYEVEGETYKLEKDKKMTEFIAPRYPNRVRQYENSDRKFGEGHLNNSTNFHTAVL